MKKRGLFPYLSLYIILAVAIAACALTTRGYLNPDFPVKMELPDNIGSYHGFDIYNCQNEDCLKSFSSEDITNNVTCPVCGGELDKISLAEHQLLPKDTEILHRSYKSSSGQVFMVAVVVGGHERRSIHKPQRCLVAQGNRINKETSVKVKISETDSLNVMLMELNRSNLFFAYWFTDGRRETSRHISRFLQIAWNGIVHNERRRWAYISVASANSSGDNSKNNLLEFIGALYSEIRISESKSNR